ncbi:MAG: phospho-N-acetylmuramoyl-pentapeptide-transferase [Clostridia bacterium]|nr:phospho-N-acetylmuramoyl-pentapeptide-transferase [Clostridia bacterium]
MNNSQTVIYAGIAMLVALLVSAVATGFLIPFLKKHQFEQAIRDFGPQSHLKKIGTPSMGGIAIVLGVIVSTLIVTACVGQLTVNVLVALFVMVCYAAIGFADDYKKAIQKKSDGLSAKKKLLFQFLACILFAFYCYFVNGKNFTGVAPGAIWIPYFNVSLNLGIFYIPWIVFIMIAFSNSVNLTDGLDGLASGVTAIVTLSMAIAAAAFRFMDLPVVFGAFCGGCLGFILYNHYPAKIFMGDTGSMAIGGGIAAVAIMMKLEFLLGIAGLIYVIESLSVIIQVSYFKATHGKRIFRMSPIHHHFELGGMKETKVVLMFYCFTVVMCLIMMLGVR